MEYDCLDVESLIGFDWDDDNVYKNENKDLIKKTGAYFSTFSYN